MIRETIALERPIYSDPLPAEADAGLSDTAGRIKSRSLIVWGEHCSECAAPACYSACSFYSPRNDGHCRRFVGGIEAVSSVGSSAVRIQFRRWGKLEGRGPVKPILAQDAVARDAQLAPRASLLSLPFLERRTAWKKTLADREFASGATIGFDAFVVEGFSRKGGEVAFTLTFVPVDKSVAQIFQTSFTLDGSWKRHAIAFSDIAKQIDLSADHLIQIEPIGEAEGIDVVFGLVDFVTWAEGKAPASPVAKSKVAATPAKFAKVVVWDLDHTVWDGILLEDGASGVTVRPGVRELMEALDARGILQSVASKNNPDEALAALEHHGLRHFMLAPQVGWGAKSTSLAQIAEILSLGLDSFVFIDDQPFERGEVQEAHPSVTVLDEHCIDTLLARDQFDVPVTKESAGRRALYAVEAERAVAAKVAGTDYDAFLRTCDLKLTLDPISVQDSERVYELSQRTNQLNVAATRYTREDVAGFINAKDGTENWVMRCADRFGDYGLIGFARVEPKSGAIIDFFMSCRVQRKRVESAFFGWLGQRMATAGASSMTSRWRKAARNGPAVEMFEALGFVLEKTDEETGALKRTHLDGFEGVDVVSVVVSDSKGAAQMSANPLSKVA